MEFWKRKKGKITILVGFALIFPRIPAETARIAFWDGTLYPRPQGIAGMGWDIFRFHIFLIGVWWILRRIKDEQILWCRLWMLPCYIMRLPCYIMMLTIGKVMQENRSLWVLAAWAPIINWIILSKLPMPHGN
jgi:hypothetical protein